MMHSAQFARTLGLSLSSIIGTGAAVPHIQTLGAITILTDNDLAANLTTRTTSAILLSPSTFETAAQRCAALNEKLWSPSQSNFSLGLNNALSYAAYVNANNGSVQYLVDSPTNLTFCNAIRVNGSAAQKPCTEVSPGLCTNSGPITQAGESFPKSDLQVTVRSGNLHITGYRDFNTFQFRGVRFSPTVERFGYASLYEGSGVVDATKYGPGCLQALDPRWPEVAEDCHFLNIWTPYLPSNASSSAQRKKLKAVMFWLTGGGNVGGTGGDLEKEGGNLASRGDVVVVSPNYRVGNLGFMAFKDGVHNGNYGVSDMLVALQWVYKNIENFGGDPKRITIWGESAGAVNVRTLLAIPEAEKWVAGAIMQSGPGETGLAGLGVRYETPTESYERYSAKIIQESGCADSEDEVACLKAYDVTKWWTEAGRAPQASNAVLDKKYISVRGLPLSGPLAHPHKIPVMYGYNRDEWSYQFPQATTNFTQNLYLVEKSLQFPLLHLANSSFAPERNPKWSTYSQAEKEHAVYRATAALSTAAIFKCLPHSFAYSAVKNGVFDKVYEFQFNRTYQPARWTGFARGACGRDNPTPDLVEYDKCHAGEVPYNFGNIAQLGWVDRDGLDGKFAQLVVDYWTAFARTGTMVPEEGYMEAKGYFDSLEQMKKAGTWTGVAKEAMRLQWTGIGTLSTDTYKVGCDELGLSEDFYEKVDFGGAK